MTGSRTRKKTALGQEYAENLANFARHAIRELDEDGAGYAGYEVFHYAFAAGTQNTLHRTQIVPPPEHWGDLKHHPHRDGFIKAAHMEFEALKSKNTFIIVLIPAGEKPIPTRWVFTYKFDESGFLIRYKARIVVRGDMEPLTGEETYAATLAFRVFRSLMALAAAYNLSTRQLDAVNAFLNARLNRRVYCRIPPGFEIPGFALWLLMALYGLRKSPLLWLQELSSTLKEFGLEQIPGEPCLWTDY